MAMSTGSSGGPRSDINVTPLVDIVLVLLIIFMVLTPLLEKEMAVRVPSNDDDVQQVDQPPQNQVVIRLFKDGRLYINKEQVTVQDFPDRLAAVMAGVPDHLAFFNAADAVPYDQVMHVLDLARGNGVATLGMITHPPKDPALMPGGAQGAPGTPAAPGAPATPPPSK